MKIIKTIFISIFAISLFSIPVFGKTRYFLPSQIECFLDGKNFFTTWYTYNEYDHLIKRSRREYGYNDLDKEEETYVYTYSYNYSKDDIRKKVKRSLEHRYVADGNVYSSVVDATFDNNGYVEQYDNDKYTWDSDGYLKSFECIHSDNTRYKGTHTYKYTFYKTGLTKKIEITHPDNTITTYKFNTKGLLYEELESDSSSSSSDGEILTYEYLYDAKGLVDEVSYYDPYYGLVVYKISYTDQSISKKRYTSILSCIIGIYSGDVSYYRSLIIR